MSKTRDERLYELTYSTKDRVELCEQILYLEGMVAELVPFSGDSCPTSCRYRDECTEDSNTGDDGLPITCVAYGHYVARALRAGVDIDEGR